MTFIHPCKLANFEPIVDEPFGDKELRAADSLVGLAKDSLVRSGNNSRKQKAAEDRTEDSEASNVTDIGSTKNVAM